ncbi:hypothetical protein QTN25_009031 [Entamoeba marina]
MSAVTNGSNFDLFAQIKLTSGRGEKRKSKERKPSTVSAPDPTEEVDSKKVGYQSNAMANLLKTLPDWSETTRKIVVTGNFETFPIAGDLPRLLKHLSIVEDRDGEFHSLFPEKGVIDREKFNAPREGEGHVKAGDCLKILEAVAEIFESEDNAKIARDEWKSVMDDTEDLSVQKTFLMQILKKAFVETNQNESPVIMFLKAINQKIIAPSTMRIKCQCGNLFIKDAQPMVWEIAVIISEGKTVISHYRRQETTSKNANEYFRFLWELRMTFNRELNQIEGLVMGISDIEFNEETTDAIRDKVTASLSDLMLPDCYVGDIDNGDE